MFGIGMTELMVIFVIGLLVLGPKRLPELARSLGRGLSEFRRASSDLRREFRDVAEDAQIHPPTLGDSTADHRDAEAASSDGPTKATEPKEPEAREPEATESETRRDG